MPENIKLSVVICTRNRAQILSATLESICTELDGIPAVELLIVNNASSDNTRDIIEFYIAKYTFVRYIDCKAIGISNARNVAVKNSFGEIIAFIDDDSYVMPGWHEELMQAFEDSSVDCVGGRVLLKWDIQKPKWFPEEFECYFTLYDLGISSFSIEDQRLPVGANMAFRKNVFYKHGGFDIRLGYSGEAKVGWEDIEMCNRILKNGGKILYAPNVLVKHLVGKDKLTKAYIKKRLFSEGYGYIFYENITNYPSKNKIKSDLITISKDVFCAFLFHIKYFIKHFKIEYKYYIDTLRRIGMLYGVIWWWRESKRYSDAIWQKRSRLEIEYYPNIIENGD